ncbi:MAG: 16S rRNA (cytidine(1402)-2'-O)-methyltransferase [Candidatus Omnitrophica bacterium]|nr:16S rRNA (cytidine(1402)-2'-O)-methyltransferase [Candidatus Omnitrophota bacterium]MDD5310209.1 16S rRNA (cytidine(1402)-2'-O)-methyltransferase [Candidatus Omnitrophota bacterium]MDD5546214.1 16S rRNA (cytidine(1402)-2'-O)-methyltransferase [Candidatus Omnitrophota bacterium]
MPSGTLYVVATPIGNLKDITIRAVEVLRGADLIAAEDTRHTKILTDHYGIKVPLTSYFEHNRITKGDYLIKLLKEGKSVALVSDAGTPGISDPGAHIIMLAIKEGIIVVGIPGPAAIILGLITSGMPTDRFIFEGFLPNKSGARRNKLSEFKDEKRTVIFYESPHRILRALYDILEIFGDIRICVMRELTKKFEEILRGKVSEIAARFEKSKPKGEFLIVLNPRRGGESD